MVALVRQQLVPLVAVGCNIGGLGMVAVVAAAEFVQLLIILVQ